MTSYRVTIRSVVIVLLLLGAVAALWRPTPVAAGVSPTPFAPTGFAPFGITFDQTARVNITYHPAELTEPLAFRVVFIDNTGHPVAEVMGECMPGQAEFVDVSGLSVGLRGGQRAQLRALVQIIDRGDRPKRRDGPSWAATLEVMDDATMGTAFIHPAVLRGFNPQPDPPMPLPF